MMGIGNVRQRRKREKEIFKAYENSIVAKREKIEKRLIEIVEYMNYEELIEFENMLNDISQGGINSYEKRNYKKNS